MNRFKLDFSDLTCSGVPSCPLVDAKHAGGEIKTKRLHM